MTKKCRFLALGAVLVFGSQLLTSAAFAGPEEDAQRARAQREFEQDQEQYREAARRMIETAAGKWSAGFDSEFEKFFDANPTTVNWKMGQALLESAKRLQGMGNYEVAGNTFIVALAKFFKTENGTAFVDGIGAKEFSDIRNELSEFSLRYMADEKLKQESWLKLAEALMEVWATSPSKSDLLQARKLIEIRSVVSLALPNQPLKVRAFIDRYVNRNAVQAGSFRYVPGVAGTYSTGRLEPRAAKSVSYYLDLLVKDIKPSDVNRTAPAKIWSMIELYGLNNQYQDRLVQGVVDTTAANALIKPSGKTCRSAFLPSFR